MTSPGVHDLLRGNADATSTPGLTTGPVYTVAVSGPKHYELAPEDDNGRTRDGATQVVRAGHTSTVHGMPVPPAPATGG
ncbi:hypothetical protein [Streptomyces griseoloalbus]|uniref:Uncharacterized protein n=1 Tax=Streptomyces griseoloalbus TaxID=67303 RepID=A0A7W8FA59_9ACTN|nr:hypothetical protein [Streptomyces albaduncus]MBB5126091.1 hypothetical protein [Streptomyces albaduncus]